MSEAPLLPPNPGTTERHFFRKGGLATLATIASLAVLAGCGGGSGDQDVRGHTATASVPIKLTGFVGFTQICKGEEPIHWDAAVQGEAVRSAVGVGQSPEAAREDAEQKATELATRVANRKLERNTGRLAASIRESTPPDCTVN